MILLYQSITKTLNIYQIKYFFLNENVKLEMRVMRKNIQNGVTLAVEVWA